MAKEKYIIMVFKVYLCLSYVSCTTILNVFVSNLYSKTFVSIFLILLALVPISQKYLPLGYNLCYMVHERKQIYVLLKTLQEVLQGDALRKIF